MRTVIWLVLLIITFVGVASRPADARTWTDRTGRQLDAEFVGFSDGKVQIKRTGDQKIFDVPIERFCDADQAFVRSQAQADPPGVLDGRASNAGIANVNKVPDATGHPAWQDDFDAFVLAYQDAIRKDAPSCNGVFAGKRVTWTLNFRELSTSAGKAEIVFDGVTRKITKGGLTGPWAQFFPNATTLAEWKSLPKGTRVCVSGTIVRAAGGEVTDNVTAEKVPWGVAEVNIDEPKTAPPPEREGLRYAPKAVAERDAATKIVSDPEIAKWEHTFQGLRKLADAGFPGAIDIVNSDARDTTTPGPSVEYIVKRYGPADRSEVKKSQITGLERIYYWYGPLAMIVSKEDNQIWGFAGTPPKTALGKQPAAQTEETESQRPAGMTTKEQAHRKNHLPSYTKELRGENEVRVRNPNPFSVQAGVRAGSAGKNLDVPPNGISSAFIPNGQYQVYFVDSNEPESLFQGDDFSLAGHGVEIQIVKVVDGNYGIRKVK